ncbi:TIGR04255 family protein [Rhizobium leguminosarum]|nr:TIGR04255 family protein [Rhizobium leguminosarum]
MGSDTRVADFDAPPLDEVVLGVQFAAPPAYSTVHAGDIWKLYSEEFPTVIEQHRLPPQFEVFGGMAQQGQFQLDFGPVALRNRLWFVAKDDSHLVQFQDDRLLLNWRRRSSGAAYPRHEGMAALFKEYLLRLERHFSTELNTPLQINQAEVSYVNMIPLTSIGDASNWVKILDLSAFDIEAFSAAMGEVIYNETRQPIARVINDFQTAWSIDAQKKALRWTLTFRGKPPKDNIESAIEFLARGRELIVNRFCEITTEKAQTIWGRHK